MWIKRSPVRSSSALRPSSCVRHRVWILLVMTHLTLDFTVCSPLTQGLVLKLKPNMVTRLRPPSQPLWDMSNKLHWRKVSPLTPHLLNPVPPPKDNGAAIGPKIKGQQHWKPAHKDKAACRECQFLQYSQTGGPLAALADAPTPLSSGSKGKTMRLLLRGKRQLKVANDDKSPDGRATTVAGFIDWGPTGPDAVEGDERSEPNVTLFLRVLSTTVSTTTSTTSRPTKRTLTVATTPEPKRLTTTKAPFSSETIKPPKPLGDTPGLAVHQIITITVSLIMVIAALITTLVLKNCCAQSGNGRHNSHQRKIHQQEESCQNLTDFTPARVPSKVDIFTAYNDSLQCSHECIRTAVPIYTDEMIQQTPVYKSAYNGNRPSPTERQLIPVAFVSEKWFEISC